MFGLGKPRSPFGRFLDENNILQERVREESGVSRDTLTRVCSDKDYTPTGKTMRSLIRAAKSLSGIHDIGPDDFWPM